MRGKEGMGTYRGWLEESGDRQRQGRDGETERNGGAGRGGGAVEKEGREGQVSGSERSR